MELGFFSRSSLSFFWRLSTKTANNLLGEGGAIAKVG
jgi:hypothetical protein